MWFDSNYDIQIVDQTDVFKILKGYEDIDRNTYINLKRIIEPEGMSQHW